MRFRAGAWRAPCHAWANWGWFPEQPWRSPWPGGEPRYGPRDAPELDKIRALGLPFRLAGGYGHAGKLAEARGLGAAGVQVGTPFAFCDESGLRPKLKRQALSLSRLGRARVFTDPVASPTGFPFNGSQTQHTLSDPADYHARRRICDIGYLRRLYRRPNGSIAYRCPAEPLAHYLRKGGIAEQTVGRKCVCNGLPATVGIGQLRAEGPDEVPLITAGDDLACLARFVRNGCDS